MQIVMVQCIQILGRNNHGLSFYRHYFQKVCLHWAKQGKFSAAKVKAIMSHSRTENAAAAWLLLAEVSSFKPKLDYKVIVECWKEYRSTG